MKQIDLGQGIAIVANVGVIVGIAFLALELRQNTAAIRGDTYQAMSDAAVLQAESLAHDPELAVIWRRAFAGESLADLSDEESARLIPYYYAVMLRMENTYNQFAAGLIDDRVFESFGWNFEIYETLSFREFWYSSGRHSSTSEEFNQFFEKRFELEPPPGLE
jgi:hypothetical protein